MPSRRENEKHLYTRYYNYPLYRCVYTTLFIELIIRENSKISIASARDRKSLATGGGGIKLRRSSVGLGHQLTGAEIDNN